VAAVGLRADQVELTRRTIIDATIELSADPEGGPITVAEVSRRSGVSPATIYRHFPTRSDLIAAAATDRFLRSLPADEVWEVDQQVEHQRSIWAELAANPELARHGTLTEAGRELRRARWAHSEPAFRESLRNLGIDPTTDEARWFVACLYLLGSAHAFLDLHDRQGMTVDEAVAASVWGSEALARAMGIEPAELRVATALLRAPEGGDRT
jgi:AcrR family transcriptional regulator